MPITKSWNETITPQKAEEYLSKNCNTRAMHQEKVDEFVKILLNNHWNPKIGRIDLSREGNLINGQHRLKAIVLANKSVELKIRQWMNKTTNHEL